MSDPVDCHWHLLRSHYKNSFHPTLVGWFDACLKFAICANEDDEFSSSVLYFFLVTLYIFSSFSLWQKKDEFLSALREHRRILTEFPSSVFLQHNHKSHDLVACCLEAAFAHPVLEDDAIAELTAILTALWEEEVVQVSFPHLCLHSILTAMHMLFFRRRRLQRLCPRSIHGSAKL